MVRLFVRGRPTFLRACGLERVSSGDLPGLSRVRETDDPDDEDDADEDLRLLAARMSFLDIKRRLFLDNSGESASSISASEFLCLGGLRLRLAPLSRFDTGLELSLLLEILSVYSWCNKVLSRRQFGPSRCSAISYHVMPVALDLQVGLN